MTGGSISAALAVEVRKTIASRVMWTTTILLIVGITVLAGTMTLAAEAGNEQVISQFGPLMQTDGWERLIGVVTQIASAAGLLGFRVALSWMVGREFAEGTITGLFALPVSRTMLTTAKLSVFLIWSLLVATILVLVIMSAGVALGSGPIDAVAGRALTRLFVLVVASGLLAIPAAWAATLGRGLLPGIATSIILVVIAQIAVVAGTGAWFPVAAPALWAMDPAAVSPVQIALVASVPIVFGSLTMAAWSRLQLDR